MTVRVTTAPLSVMTCTLVDGAVAEDVTTVRKVDDGLVFDREVAAFDDEESIEEEGTEVALLTSVEEACEPPPAVPEGCPASLM